MTLTAGRCAHCGHVAYPAEPICSACAHRGDAEAVALSEGSLYTFTVVHAAAPDVKTPYALGYVDFAEGARLFGRILYGDGLAVGMRVRLRSAEGDDGLCFEVIGDDGGTACGEWLSPGPA